MKRRARRDENEAAIVAALRSVGALVFQLDAEDLPDLLVGHRGRWLLCEVKVEAGARGGTSGRNLRPGQRMFFALARSVGAPTFLVRSVDDALAAVGVEVAPR